MSGTVAGIEPALYCGTYGKYNDGSIDGKWLQLTDYPDAEAFLEACRAIHKDEADPELMFQDCEGIPHELYGESLSLGDVRKLYDWLHLADDDRQVLAEYLDATGYRLDNVDIARIRDKLYCVLNDLDMLDHEKAMGWYAVDNGLVDIPTYLTSYIDLAALGRDWLRDFSVSTNGYVFEA